MKRLDVTMAILTLVTCATCVMAENKSSSIQYEYAILTEFEVIKEPNAHNQSSLRWRAPNGQLKVDGKDLYGQLLNQMGQKTDSDTRYDLYDLLNHLGSQGWDLCTAIARPPESESQVNKSTRYVFKRAK